MTINPWLMLIIVVGLVLVFVIAILPVVRPILDEVVEILKHKGDEQATILRVLIILFLLVFILVAIFFTSSLFDDEITPPLGQPTPNAEL